MIMGLSPSSRIVLMAIVPILIVLILAINHFSTKINGWMSVT